MPGKIPDIATQTEFVNWYNKKIKEAIASKVHILFYDPVH